MGSNNNSLAERLAQAVAVLRTEEPAKPVAKAKVEPKAKKAKKARKTTARKAVANGTVTGHKCLVQKNRPQFIADHDWAQPHTSTSDLARAVIAGAPLTGVWALGPKTVERLTGQDTGAITVESQGGKPVKAKKGGKKGGKKAKARAAAKTTTRTISEAEQARLDAPRDAMGRATPKREWDLREQLAVAGRSRHEIEADVAAAYAQGVITLPGSAGAHV